MTHTVSFFNVLFSCHLFCFEAVGSTHGAHVSSVFLLCVTVLMAAGWKVRGQICWRERDRAGFNCTAPYPPNFFVPT